MLNHFGCDVVAFEQFIMGATSSRTLANILANRLKSSLTLAVSSKHSPKRCSKLDLKSDTVLGFFRKEVSLKETGRGGLVCFYSPSQRNRKMIR